MQGFAYLTNILTGVFAQYVRSTLIVPGDVAATAGNITASELLFRLGFVSDLIMAAAYLLMGVFFYMLLRPVNRDLALLMLMLNLAGVPMLGINMLNEFAPLLLLNGASYLQAFPAAQLQALAMFFLDLQNYGYLIAAISYGAYLLPLGYLVFRSGYLPRHPGHPADDRLFRPDGPLIPGVPAPGLRRDHLSGACRCGAGGILILPVAADQRRQNTRSETRERARRMNGYGTH